MILEVFIKEPCDLPYIQWLFGNGERCNRPVRLTGGRPGLITKNISTEELEALRFAVESGVRFRMYPQYELSQNQRDYLKYVEHDVRIIFEEDRLLV